MKKLSLRRLFLFLLVSSFVISCTWQTQLWWNIGVGIIRPFDIILAVIFFVMIIIKFLDSGVSIPTDGGLLGLYLLLIITTASLFWTTKIITTSVEVIQVLEFIVLYMTLSFLIQNRDDVYWVLSIFLAVIVLSELVRYSIIGVGWLKFGVQRVRPWSVMVGLGIALWIGFSLSLIDYRSYRPFITRMSKYAVFPLFLFVIISLDRKVWLAIPFSAIFMFAFSPLNISQKVKRLFFILVLLSAAILVISLFAGGSWMYVKREYSTLVAIGRGEGATGIDTRVAALQSSLEFIIARPLGGGMGVLDPLYSDIFLSKPMTIRRALGTHNIIMDYGVYLGIMGMLVIMFLIMVVIFRLIWLGKRPITQRLVFIALVGFATYGIIILMTNSGGLEREGILMWLLGLTRRRFFSARIGFEETK